MVSTPYLFDSNANPDEIPFIPRIFSSAPINLQPKLQKLADKLASESEFEHPEAYWRALWNKPPDEAVKGKIRVQIQGSVVRVVSRRPQGEKGRVFEKDWDQPPWMYGDDFLADGFDRNNSNDRELHGLRRPKGNKRKIHEFSSNSRRLLLDRLLSLDPKMWDRAKFVTLTYHNEWPTPARAKANLRAFYKRVVRYCERTRTRLKYTPAYFWRMEIKDRLTGDRAGEPAPHFHLFLFGCPRIPQHMLLDWWREIVEDQTITQLDIKMLDSRRKAMNYVAKYVAKPSEGDEMVGGFTPEPEPADFAVLTRSVIAKHKLKKELMNELDRDLKINDPSMVVTEETEVSPYLDITLYLAGMGRFWGLEGGQNILYASCVEVALPPLDASLSAFITVCEGMYPHLVSRWAVGFRLFVFEGDSENFKNILFDLLYPAERTEPDIDRESMAWLVQSWNDTHVDF